MNGRNLKKFWQYKHLLIRLPLVMVEPSLKVWAAGGVPGSVAMEMNRCLDVFLPGPGGFCDADAVLLQTFTKK